MTNRSSLRSSARTDTLLHSGERLTVGGDDVVGVVLLGLGGPASRAEVESYVYELLMDPQRVRLPWLPTFLRRRVARYLARRRTPDLSASLTTVGGAAPDLRLLSEQARALETELRRQADAEHHLTFHVYAACRYRPSSMTAVVRQMREAGVTRVVLVPTAPVPMQAVSGTCLSAWRRAVVDAEFEHVPTVAVCDQSQSPLLEQALSERLDEALQRFPRAVRDDVQIVFALHPAAALDARSGAPEQTPLAPLVDAMLHQRVEQRLHHYAYVQNWGLSRQPSPVLLEVIEQITASGGTGVVVVPVGFSTDTMETVYELDVMLRNRSEVLGLQQYEIAAALNCNPLYLQMLATLVGARLRLIDVPGDGAFVPVPVAATPAPSRDGRI